jgi:hypothetical protein
MTVQGVLYAFNADTLNLLWSDKTNDARDEVGNFAKYVPPLVANGKLYMATFGPLGTADGSGALVVYGLLQPPLTVNVANATMATSAALPTFTGSVSGLVNGDTLGTTVIVTYSTTATSNSPAGTYPITATVSGTSATNYFVTVNAGTLTISPAGAQTLTVAASSATRTYGAANPAFTGTVTGAQNGDTFTESFSTTATAASSVGSYPIVPAASGTNLGNYSVVIVDGALTVTPAALTVAANNASRVYGAANPAFSGTIKGAAGSDSFAESFTTTATTTSKVGSYPIVPAVTGPQSNYSVTLVSGALTVTGAPTSTALSAPASAAYGASVALTATVSSTAGTPGGTVTFTSGSTTLGTGTLNASGAASLNTTALPAGTNTVTAVYAAAGNFAASTSTAVTVSISAPPGTVASYSISASPTSLTVKQGAAVNTTLTFTPTGGYKDTVSLSYSNLPANVSCVFAQNQVVFTGNNQSVNVVMTLQTGTQSSVRQTPSGAPLPTALLALAFWWPGSLTGIAVFARKRKLAKMGVSWQICLLLLCTLACAAGLSGCGGASFQAQATSPTSAQVTVVATGSSATAVPQTLVVTLNITQ